MSTINNPLSPLPVYPGTTPRYHAMVKPIGAICNLDCTYCYYLHKEQLLGSNSKFRMTDEILEAHIRQYIEAQRGDEVVFSWQGGEPTLLGVEFFERVVALEKKYQRPGLRIENDLQTNGTLLNDEWYAFLRKNKFLVGLSIDGPQELHDTYRVNKGGKATFDKVFAAGLQLQKYGIPFNTLTVVNRVNAKKPLDVYRFLTRELRPRQLQFIPCVEPKVFRDVAPQKWELGSLPLQGSAAAHPGNPDSVVTDWSVDPDDWGYFLCKVWDDWSSCRDYAFAQETAATPATPDQSTGKPAALTKSGRLRGESCTEPCASIQRVPLRNNTEYGGWTNDRRRAELLRSLRSYPRVLEPDQPNHSADVCRRSTAVVAWLVRPKRHEAQFGLSPAKPRKLIWGVGRPL